LSNNELSTRVVDPRSIDTGKSWVSGEGGFHSFTLSSYGNRSESWRTQWKVIERWDARLLKTGKVTNDNVVDATDFVHAFAIACFHLKDCVAVSLNQKFESGEDFEMFWFPEFLICRDLANGLKHLSINRPSMSPMVAFHREMDGLTKETLIKVDIYLEQDLYSYTNVEFAARCVAIWREYLMLKGLKSESRE
jgi:hypothetical protein